jgi:hypothetical protein
MAGRLNSMSWAFVGGAIVEATLVLTMSKIWESAQLAGSIEMQAAQHAIRNRVNVSVSIGIQKARVEDNDVTRSRGGGVGSSAREPMRSRNWDGLPAL